MLYDNENKINFIADRKYKDYVEWYANHVQ